MTEYILTIFIICVIIYAFIKGCNINININVKQEFSNEDRQLLEDLFNKDGDPKDKDDEARATLDEFVQTVNSIMLGEEDLNG